MKDKQEEDWNYLKKTLSGGNKGAGNGKNGRGQDEGFFNNFSNARDGNMAR